MRELNIRAQLVTDIDCAACGGDGCLVCDHSGYAPAGSFQWSEDRDGSIDLLYTCPCGCGVARAVPVALSWEPGKRWGWDGNREAPTLTPSLDILADHGGSHWHGWLQGGEWRQC